MGTKETPAVWAKPGRRGVLSANTGRDSRRSAPCWPSLAQTTRCQGPVARPTCRARESSASTGPVGPVGKMTGWIPRSPVPPAMPPASKAGSRAIQNRLPSRQIRAGLVPQPPQPVAVAGSDPAPPTRPSLSLLVPSLTSLSTPSTRSSSLGQGSVSTYTSSELYTTCHTQVSAASNSVNSITREPLVPVYRCMSQCYPMFGVKPSGRSPGSGVSQSLWITKSTSLSV